MGKYEAEMVGREGKMTELNAEQALIEKIAQEGVNLYNFPNLWERLNRVEKDNWRNWAKTAILPLILQAFPELAKERGYVLLGEFDYVVKKPITGLPQIGNFPPEEYQPILGDIPPEPWELTGYSGDRYLTVEGRKTILDDVYLARKAKADWLALSPEDKVRLEQEQEDRRTEE